MGKWVEVQHRGTWLQLVNVDMLEQVECRRYGPEVWAVMGEGRGATHILGYAKTEDEARYLMRDLLNPDSMVGVPEMWLPRKRSCSA